MGDNIYLGGQNDRITVKVEGEGAGEVEGPGEPPPGGDKKHRAAIRGELAQVRNRRTESRRVGGGAVAHPTEVRQGGRVGPADGGGVLERIYTLVAVLVRPGNVAFSPDTFCWSDECCH